MVSIIPTTLKNWWESTGIGFVHQVTKQRQDIRSVQNLQKTLQDQKKKIESVIETGMLNEILVEYKNYATHRRSEVEKLQDIIIKFKVILSKDYKLTLELLDACKGDKALSKGERQQVVKVISAAQKAVLSDASTLLRDIGSYRSTSLNSFKQKLLGDASQIANEKYKIAIERQETVKVKQLFTTEIKQLRKGKRVTGNDKNLMLIPPMLAQQLNDGMEIIESTLVLLQVIQQELKADYQYLQQLQKERKYPESWATKDYGPLKDLNDDIEHWMDKELKEERILVSEFEHEQVDESIAA